MLLLCGVLSWNPLDCLTKSGKKKNAQDAVFKLNLCIHTTHSTKGRGGTTSESEMKLQISMWVVYFFPCSPKNNQFQLSAHLKVNRHNGLSPRFEPENIVPKLMAEYTRIDE